MNILTQAHNQMLELPNGNLSSSYNLPSLGRGTALALVLLAHIGVLFALAQAKITTTPIETAKPITVSLIASAPIIDSAPVEPIVQTKKEVQPKEIVQPKKITPQLPKKEKVITPVKPVEKAVEPVIQESAPEVTEVSQAEPVKEETAPAPANEPTPEKPAAKVEEDKIDPPKFGVAYLNNPAPKYPTLSKRAGEHGRVVLKVLVSIKGDAETVEVNTSSGSDRLDNAAVDAVKRWRFVPARKGGQALSAYVLVPIKFSLDSALNR
jgi:periplasmic protein TonB